MSARFEWVEKDYRVVIQKGDEKPFDRRIAQLVYQQDANGDFSVEGLIFDNDGQLVPISEVAAAPNASQPPFPRSMAGESRLCLPYRSQIAVEPVQNLSDGVFDRHDVPAFEQSMPFLRLGSPQQAE